VGHHNLGRVPERVCHIVPAVPPEFNGLGDYARQLWRHWPEPRPDWHVAALRVPAGAAEAWPGVAFHPFRPNAESLLEALLESRADSVALHYVGHGYHPNGVPLWLPKALARWKSATGGRLVTFFHELWVEGGRWPAWPLWRAGGKILAKRLGAQSQSSLTSCHLYRQMLLEIGVEALQTPVGPNVAPIKCVDWSRKYCPPFRVAIFGMPRTRERAMQILLRQLDVKRSQLLCELYMIGAKPIGPLEASLERQIQSYVPLKRFLDVSEVTASSLLHECDLGVADVRYEILGKSGTATAMLHHGCLVLAPDSEPAFSPLHPIALLDAADHRKIHSKAERRAAYVEESSWPKISRAFAATL